MTDDVMDYTETLRYTQSLRKRLVDEYTKSGMEKLIEDEKSVDRMLKALKDMDTQVLNERKNEIDQHGADSSREVADAMKQLVEMQQNQNPFKRQADGSILTVPTVDEGKLGTHDLVEGEAEQGVVMETSGEFFARMEALRREKEARGELLE